MFIRLLIAFASVMQAMLLLAGQESWAARAEIASRVVCKQADYRFPVEQSQCTPSYALPVGRCNALMRRCVCQHYIFLKWTGKGCGPKRVGDGGCQCLDYCGWKCRSKCIADPEKRCEWVNNGCISKFTNTTGPLTVCYASPSEAPTMSPSIQLNPSPLPPIDLGTAANFVILTKSGVSNVPLSRIVGDVGVSPISAPAITGFTLILVGPSNEYATSINVVGKVFAADYAGTTPAMLTTAVLDMETAYTTAAGLPSGINEFATGNLGGKTLTSGIYRWGTNVNIPTSVTISGASNDVWVFQIAGNLIEASAAEIVLQGGAQAKNIFWQVAGQVNIGTNAHFEGVILCKTGINLKTGATMNGRALAQTAVTLDHNEVIIPA